MIKTIADIRAVNYWGWVFCSELKREWGIIRQEIQLKDPSGKWTPIEVVDINKDGQDAV